MIDDKNINSTDNEISFSELDNEKKKQREIYDSLFAPLCTFDEFQKIDYKLVMLNLALLIDDKKKFREYLDKVIREIKKS